MQSQIEGFSGNHRSTKKESGGGRKGERKQEESGNKKPEKIKKTSCRNQKRFSPLQSQNEQGKQYKTRRRRKAGSE